MFHEGVIPEKVKIAVVITGSIIVSSEQWLGTVEERGTETVSRKSYKCEKKFWESFVNESQFFRWLFHTSNDVTVFFLMLVS